MDAEQSNDARTDRQRRLLWLGLVAIAITTSLASYLSIAGELSLNARHIAADFIVFWTAAQATQPYDIAALTAAQQWYMASDAVRPFAYPPSFLPWLAPLPLLPMIPAFLAWTAATAALFVTAWGRIVPRRIAFLSLAAPTVLLAAIPGQMVLLLGAMIAAGFTLIERRPLLAGVLFGVAATIKPQALLLLPLALVAGRHWRALGGAAVSGTAFGLACLAVQGPELWRAWLEALPAFMQVVRDGGMIHFGITPASALERAGIEGAPATTLLVIAGMIGLATLWATFTATRDTAARILALNVATLLILPYAMPYELALSAPAAATMLLDRNRPAAITFAAMLALTAVGGTLGLVAIALILAWMVRREKQGEAVATPALPAQA